MDEAETTGEAQTSPIQSAMGRPRKTPAPGAISSPQEPGQVPDHSTIPGHHSQRVPPRHSVRRPLTQYGTAEEIMRVFRKFGDAEIEPAQFEQATASYEELRKANLATLPPVRPAPGYALEPGDDAPLPLASDSADGDF